MENKKGVVTQGQNEERDISKEIKRGSER